MCIIIISVTLSVRFSTGGEDEKFFTPGDTRIHSFSSFFCSGLQVQVPELPSGSTGHAYLIDTVPPLSERNTVNFTQYFTLDPGDYEYWHYYLYKGSNISYSACISENSPATSFRFYIVKGTSKFSSWKDEPSSSKSVSSVYVTTSCDQGFNHLSYSIKDEDHYYLAYSQYTGSSRVQGTQNMIIDRFEYSAPNTSLYSCELSNDNTCTLSVGFSAKKNKGLVILPIPSNVDWDNTVYNVMFKCSPQAIGYVIITLVPLAFVFMVLFVIMIYCVYRAKKSSSKSIGVQGTSETEKTPLHDDQPPPYNPNY